MTEYATTIVRTKSGAVHEFNLELTIDDAYARFTAGSGDALVDVNGDFVKIDPNSVESVKVLEDPQ